MVPFNRIATVLFVLSVGGSKCCTHRVDCTGEVSRQIDVKTFSSQLNSK